MAAVGFLIALVLFLHFKRQLSEHRSRESLAESTKGTAQPVSWHEQWHRQWAEKFHRQAERRIHEIEREAERRRRRLLRKARAFGLAFVGAADREGLIEAEEGRVGEARAIDIARKRARAEAGYYTHLLTYLGVIAILALVNVFTTHYPWFIWPALGWGLGLFSHYMAVFGSRLVKERYFYPAIDREVRREKAVMQTEKQASIDELSASIAHEIRNPIAAAKSLVQQIGEDPSSAENSEYARVAVKELDRVERRISHLLKYAKEEDYNFERVNLASSLDAALTQLRAKLDAARVSVSRNYIGGPTVLADPEKLRQVFANILDNAIDAVQSAENGRRIDLFLESGPRTATVRLRDNGCGIPATEIDRIFNPFFTTKQDGTGLGMAISKKILEAHDGAINVVSERGRGAEFIVSLPLPG